MGKINLLVVDDEIEEVERYIKRLKENDVNDILGNCFFAKELPNDVSDIEKYDVLKSASVDDVSSISAVLIDYDLGKTYSGTLLSAWLMLKNRCIPRIAFTTRKYSGENADFDGYIEKRDIIIDPEKIISTIINTINKFNMDEWLQLKYEEFVRIYSELTIKKISNNISKEEVDMLALIVKILDSLDKQLDREIERSINIKLNLSEEKNEKLDELENTIDELGKKVEGILSKFEE